MDAEGKPRVSLFDFDIERATSSESCVQEPVRQEGVQSTSDGCFSTMSETQTKSAGSLEACPGKCCEPGCTEPNQPRSRDVLNVTAK